MSAVPISELRGADVLLYHGNAWISKAIRFFDGSEYSHAALYLGSGSVGEAVSAGVVKRDLQTSRGDSKFVDARRLKARVETMDPVLAVSASILKQKQRYAYEQIILLALLAVSRKPKWTPVLRRLIRSVLDRAASTLSKLAAGKRQPMICSEFVFRCFAEAVGGEQDPYTIRIDTMDESILFAAPKGRGIDPESLLAWRLDATGEVWRAPAMEQELPEKKATEAEIEQLAEIYLKEVRTDREAAPVAQVSDRALRGSLDQFAEALHRSLTTGREIPETKEKVGPAPLETLANVASDFVTPGDLARTDSLFDIGRLKNA